MTVETNKDRVVIRKFSTIIDGGNSSRNQSVVTSPKQ